MISTLATGGVGWPMVRMTTALRPLMLTELSLVDEPANKGARVAIYKRADRTEPDMQPTSVLPQPNRPVWLG